MRSAHLQVRTNSPSKSFKMKSFTVLSATILAIASSASAELGFALGPLTVQTLTESKTARADFTVRDLDHGGTTTCSTAWYVP